jgi:hypothetical protein
MPRKKGSIGRPDASIDKQTMTTNRYKRALLVVEAQFRAQLQLHAEIETQVTALQEREKVSWMLHSTRPEGVLL